MSHPTQHVQVYKYSAPAKEALDLTNHPDTSIMKPVNSCIRGDFFSPSPFSTLKKIPTPAKKLPIPT